jgi:uncharacterized membrane protein
VLHIQIPSYSLASETHEGIRYDRLNLPESGQTAQIGRPQVPVVNALIGVPADATLSVEVDQTVSQALPGKIRLLPAPALLRDEAGSVTSVFEPDAQAYVSRENYPVEIAHIADDGWLRDQRIARIAIHPFQYQAASQQITWHRELWVTVRFGKAVGDAKPVTSPAANIQPFEPLLQRNLLNYAQARAWRSSTALSGSTQAALRSDDLATRYKIVVEQDGLYHLTYTDALQAGFAASDPRNWQITNLGSTVAITITGQADGSFDPGDEVIFYGERFRGDRFAARYPDEASIYWLMNNCDKTYCAPETLPYRQDAGLHMEKYTSENVYWLYLNTTPGARISTVNAAPTGLTPITVYTATQHSEQQAFWFSYPILDADTWFWERVQPPNPSVMYSRNYLVPLSNIASSTPVSASVRGAMVATTYSSSISPDHHTRVLLNGAANVVDDAWWDGMARHTFEKQLPLTALLDGNNTFTLEIHPITDVSQRMYPDWFEIEYPRSLSAINDELRFESRQSGPQAFRVSGYTAAQIWALDISQPLTPTLLTAPNIVQQNAAYTITFEVDEAQDKTYFVGALSALRTPKEISAYTPPDLLAQTNGADYIFITHSSFVTATQQLADYRAAQGMRTAVVDIDDVYNLFGDGIFNPVAIKNFLRYAYHNWQPPAPTYVLLVGDGHFNFLNRVRTSGQVFPAMTVPPYLVTTDSWQGDMDSANLLVTLVGNDVLPEMLIGRLPVETSQQINDIVNKISVFESTPYQDWHNNLVFVTDNTPDPAGDFVAQSDELLDNHIPADQTVEKFYLNDYLPTPCSTADTFCQQIRDDIVNTLNGPGALFVNYMGHGSVQYWAAQPNVFRNADIASLTNASRPTIALDLTCLTGLWFNDNQNASRPSLAVAMLRHPTGGSVASFAPTSRGVSTGHDTLARGFYDAIYQDEVRILGEATLGGQMRLFASGYNLDLVNTFVLFGDPALRLPLPTHRPALAAQPQAQQTLPGQEVTYTFTLTNTGSITDTFSLAASGNLWPVQLSQASVGPLAPGDSAGVQMTVQPPWNAEQGEVSMTTLTATSQGNPYQSASQSVSTTIHITPGVSVTPPGTQEQALPAETVQFTLQVTNTGDFTDTFAVEIESAWPVTLSPTSLAPLASSATTSLLVYVHIPASILFSQTEVTTITLRSQHDANVLDTALLETVVDIQRGVSLAPTSAETQGLPGETVHYQLFVTNQGNFTDTFTITSAGGWPIAAPTTVGPLGASNSAGLTVDILVPVTTTLTQTDVHTITVRSQADPSILASAILTTEVNIRNGVAVAPTSAAQQGLPGATLQYTLQVTNTGNITDSVTVEAAGSWPTSVIPLAFDDLLPGASGTLTVRVTIPLTVTIGQSDLTTLTLRSHNDPTQTATATLHTAVDIRGGVDVAPTSGAAMGLPGDSVAYTLQVTNTGNLTDTFDLTAVSGWPVSLQPGSFDGLLAGQSATLTVHVTIPLTVTIGQSDLTTLTLRSHNDPTKTATATLHTAVDIRGGVTVAPITATAQGLPGEVVTFTIAITNTGNLTDTFDLATSTAWPLALPADVGPLAAGATTDLQIAVQIPASAGTGETIPITLRSHNDPTVTATVTLQIEISQAAGWKIYLPLIVRQAGGPASR